MNFTVQSRGRQFDRLGIMYLGDIEVFRTSTAEPTANGIIWTYVKEMEQYNALWGTNQKVIFDLGNLVREHIFHNICRISPQCYSLSGAKSILCSPHILLNPHPLPQRKHTNSEMCKKVNSVYTGSFYTELTGSYFPGPLFLCSCKSGAPKVVSRLPCSL